jgi:hypothetical protein
VNAGTGAPTSVARQVFDDLLTLEVNIILKPCMTARKMPDLPHALLDVFADYDAWLCRLGARGFDEAWERFRATPAAAAHAAQAPDDDWLVTGHDLIRAPHLQGLYEGSRPITAADFDELRGRARRAEEMFGLLVRHGFLEEDGSSIILKRIFRNCDQIKGILEGRNLDQGTGRERLREAARRGISREGSEPGDLPLTADEVLVVRKAWEVGTETVVMQTVAQLDGDIVTRVQEARLTAGDALLHDLHREAVGSAVQHWRFLFEAFVQVTTRAAGFFSRSSR